MPSRKGRTSKPALTARAAGQTKKPARRIAPETGHRRLLSDLEALQVTEGRLRAILENSQDIVLLAEHDGTFSYCHSWPAYGLSPDAVLGKTAWDVLPAKEAALFEARLRHVFTTGLPLVLEEEMDLGGRSLWLLEQFRPVRDSHGWVCSVSVILRDVDQVKKAEKILRESEERHRQMYEGNPLPMMVFDAETLRFLSVNEAALAHYGYTRDEFLRMGIPDIRPAEDVPAVIENIRTRPAGMARPGVRRHIKKNGEVISVEVVSHSISFEGRPAWLVLCQDVTRRIQNEGKLALQRSRLELHNLLYRAILDGQDAKNVLRRSLEAAEGLLPCERVSYTSWDPVRRSSRLVLVKTAAGFDEPDKEIPFDGTNHLHLQMEALFTRNQPLYLPDIDKVGGLPENTRGRMGEGFFSVVFQPVVAKGETFGILSFWSRRPDAFSAEMVALIGTLAETLLIAFEKDRLNRQIRHHTTHLEEQVALRTRELQAAYDELESFTYTVTHDLRAPLRALQGFSQILLDGYSDRLDETGQGYLQFVRNSAQRMDTLIMDLLAYSRLGRAEFKNIPILLDTVVKDALHEMSMVILDARASIRLQIPEILVRCHRATLMQILNNLVANAIKFVEPGVTPELRIEAERLDRFARLTVADNGIGIETEHQARIFNVFERLHGYEEYPGTGIGLAIAKRGIEKLGGRIGVWSEKGSGSRFWIDIPLSEDTH